MRKLFRIILIALTYFLSRPAFADCPSNRECSADLPNDLEQHRMYGRISVKLTGRDWEVAYEIGQDSDLTFQDSSCECLNDGIRTTGEILTGKFNQLRRSRWDWIYVSCLRKSADDFVWIETGAYHPSEQDIRGSEGWGKYFCGTDSYSFRSGTDLQAHSIEIAPGFENDTD